MENCLCQKSFEGFDLTALQLKGCFLRVMCLSMLWVLRPNSAFIFYVFKINLFHISVWLLALIESPE